LLCEPKFEEANNEFIMAHRHLREGNRRDCNTAALRSMENVLKVICDARGWIYRKGDAVEQLLAVVRGNGLFPDYRRPRHQIPTQIATAPYNVFGPSIYEPKELCSRTLR
jgi:hypothetical protein